MLHEEKTARWWLSHSLTRITLPPFLKTMCLCWMVSMCRPDAIAASLEVNNKHHLLEKCQHLPKQIEIAWNGFVVLRWYAVDRCEEPVCITTFPTFEGHRTAWPRRPGARGWMPQHLGPRTAGCATSSEIQGFGGARFMPDNILLPSCYHPATLQIILTCLLQCYLCCKMLQWFFRIRPISTCLSLQKLKEDRLMLTDSWRITFYTDLLCPCMLCLIVRLLVVPRHPFCTFICRVKLHGFSQHFQNWILNLV